MIFQKISYFFLFILLSFSIACADISKGVFPDVETSTSESTVVLPNPISLIVDETNSQVIVANSNVDIFFDSGSLAVLNIDTSGGSVALSASQILETPNFAGELAFNATNSSLYVNFREASSSDDSKDQVSQYALGAGSLSLTTNTTVTGNPFGTAVDSSGNVYVVSDETLSIYDSSLNLTQTIDLSVAEDAGFENTNATFVEYVAIDETRNLAFVSNPNGYLFVVDLATASLTAFIAGPESTRNLLIDNNNLYAIDAVTASVWVFDLADLTISSSSVESIDDSTFLLDVIPVGVNPNGIALDTINNRLYVANSNENTISVIDTNSLTELARVSVDDDDLTSFNRAGDFPFAIATGTFNAKEYIFVAAFSSNAVIVIDSTTLNVVEVFPNNTL